MEIPESYRGELIVDVLRSKYDAPVRTRAKQQAERTEGYFTDIFSDTTQFQLRVTQGYFTNRKCTLVARFRGISVEALDLIEDRLREINAERKAEADIAGIFK